MEIKKKNFFSAMRDAWKRSTAAMLCMVVIGVCLLGGGCDKVKNGLEGGNQTTDTNKDGEENMISQNACLIDTNKIWKNLEYCQWGTESYINNYFIKIGKDTILNSYTYKQVYHSKSENFDTVVIVGFIRENGKKVYFLEKSGLKEGLLYDFGISVNGQVTIQNYFLNGSTQSLILEEIVPVNIGGKLIQKFIFQDTEEYWLEGIGSTLGILNSGFRDTIGCSYELIFFKENALAGASLQLVSHP